MPKPGEPGYIPPDEHFDIMRDCLALITLSNQLDGGGPVFQQAVNDCGADLERARFAIAIMAYIVTLPAAGGLRRRAAHTTAGDVRGSLQQRGRA